MLQFTPIIPQQALLREHIVIGAPTQLSYIERSVSVKDVDAQDKRFFDWGVEGVLDVPLYIVVGIQNKNRLDSAAQVRIFSLDLMLKVPNAFSEKKANLKQA